MISFSKLLLDHENFGDTLRYHPQVRGTNKGTTINRGPIVVWNCTQVCNLKCRHCYASAVNTHQPGELLTDEAKLFMDSLVKYRVPVLLFSGGEPLLRPDIFELFAYGRDLGLRMVISTNGTLIDLQKAQRIKDLGISYVGISLDGQEAVNDVFRGMQGAFQKALAGLRNCRQVGQKTGLRLTLNKMNINDLPVIFDLIKEEAIPRVCFYHLAYSGRGSEMENEDLSPQETRDVLDYIIEKTIELNNHENKVEILTVDNHCDGIYLYQYLKGKNPAQAKRVLQLITSNGGNRSGQAIASVDWTGNVYIDQFTRDLPLGNIKEADFGDIWDGEDNPFLSQLRNRGQYLRGRCRECGWLKQCNGNLRARAFSTGDFWSEDPACYLSSEEREMGYEING